jgi:hypothetical protein
MSAGAACVGTDGQGSGAGEVGVAADNELLLVEYNNCAEVANHIDNVRNVITSFFLTINGGVLIVLSLVVTGDVQEGAFGSPKALLAGVLLMVCTLGTLFTGTLARLQRVQIGRYRIANGILDHVLPSGTRALIPLTDRSLATDAGGSGLGKRTTGSYLWKLTIMLPTSAIAGLTGYLVADIHDVVEGPLSWAGALALGAVALLIHDRIYFGLSKFTRLDCIGQTPDTR